MFFMTFPSLKCNRGIYIVVGMWLSDSNLQFVLMIFLLQDMKFVNNLDTKAGFCGYLGGGDVKY